MNMFISNILVYIMQSTCFIQQASLPSLEECLHEAETLKNQIRPVDCIRYYVVSSTPEVALEIGLEYIKGTKSQNDSSLFVWQFLTDRIDATTYCETIYLETIGKKMLFSWLSALQGHSHKFHSHKFHN